MKKTASAVWEGGLVSGSGRVSSGSKALDDAPYTFHSRTEHGEGVSPEELLAAAHATCFSMQLSRELELAQLRAKAIYTTATVTLETDEKSWMITDTHLELCAEIPRGHLAPFLAATERARDNCPISRLMKDPITLNSRLDESSELDQAPDLIIYTSSYSPVTAQIKKLFKERGLSYREVDLDELPEGKTRWLKERTGLMTVPQIFVGDQFIGNYEDLLRLDARHGLERLFPKKWAQPAGDKQSA